MPQLIGADWFYPSITAPRQLSDGSITHIPYTGRGIYAQVSVKTTVSYINYGRPYNIRALITPLILPVADYMDKVRR